MAIKSIKITAAMVVSAVQMANAVKVSADKKQGGVLKAAKKMIPAVAIAATSATTGVQACEINADGDLILESGGSRIQCFLGGQTIPGNVQIVGTNASQVVFQGDFDIDGSLIIEANPNLEFVNMDMSSDPQTIGGNLIARDNDELRSLNLFRTARVDGDVVIENNPTLGDIPNYGNGLFLNFFEPVTVGGDFVFENNDAYETFAVPRLAEVGGDLTVADNDRLRIAEFGDPTEEDGLQRVGGTTTCRDNAIMQEFSVDKLANGPINIHDNPNLRRVANRAPGLVADKFDTWGNNKDSCLISSRNCPSKCDVVDGEIKFRKNGYDVQCDVDGQRLKNIDVSDTDIYALGLNGEFSVEGDYKIANNPYLVFLRDYQLKEVGGDAVYQNVPRIFNGVNVPFDVEGTVKVKDQPRGQVYLGGKKLGGLRVENSGTGTAGTVGNVLVRSGLDLTKIDGDVELLNNGWILEAWFNNLKEIGGSLRVEGNERFGEVNSQGLLIDLGVSLNAGTDISNVQFEKVGKNLRVLANPDNVRPPRPGNPLAVGDVVNRLVTYEEFSNGEVNAVVATDLEADTTLDADGHLTAIANVAIPAELEQQLLITRAVTIGGDYIFNNNPTYETLAMTQSGSVGGKIEIKDNEAMKTIQFDTRGSADVEVSGNNELGLARFPNLENGAVTARNNEKLQELYLAAHEDLAQVDAANNERDCWVVGAANGQTGKSCA